jgi:hypothetical protein
MYPVSSIQYPVSSVQCPHTKPDPKKGKWNHGSLAPVKHQTCIWPLMIYDFPNIIRLIRLIANDGEMRERQAVRRKYKLIYEITTCCPPIPCHPRPGCSAWMAVLGI